MMPKRQKKDRGSLSPSPNDKGDNSLSNSADSAQDQRKLRSDSEEGAGSSKTSDLAKDHSTINPGSEETAINRRVVTVNLSKRDELTHIFYLYYIPSVPDKVKPQLNKLREKFRDWHAYEVGNAEGHVQLRISAGELPSDDSAASRAKRSQARARIVENLRKHCMTL